MEGRSHHLREADRVVAALAARQHGVVSRIQLVEVGMGKAAIDGRLAAGRLHPVHKGVYLVGHTARASLALEMAAVLACGAGTAVSHRSAAWLWAVVNTRPRLVEVIVRRRWRSDRRGIRVYARPDLADDEVRRIRGVPVTTPARTVLDLGASTPADEYERIAAEALAQNLVEEKELVEMLDRHRGRTGAAALRRLIQADGSPARVRSRAERELLRLLRASSLPAAETNAPVGPYEIDFLWRDHRLAVEVDGYAFHSQRPKFERDRLRDAHLQVRGFRVMRVTWRQLTREPEAVLARIRALLATEGIFPP